MYVLRGFDSTTPSLTIPMPSLLALPSNPMEMTIFKGNVYLKYFSRKLAVRLSS